VQRHSPWLWRVGAQLTVSHARIDRHGGCASGSNATTSSIDFKDRKLCVLSAILLKAMTRSLSTFSLLCFLTYIIRTCSSELAEYKRSVLYSRLPAPVLQLFFDAPGQQRVRIPGLPTAHRRP